MRTLPRLLVVSTTGLLIGCGARVAPQAPAPPVHSLPVTTFTAVPAPPITITPDRVAGIIASVEKEFDAGRVEWQASRIVKAREHFDRALEILITLPEGARGEPRLRAEFESLLDRISALDVLALREADGVTEAKTEPAAIDELLNAALVERPKPAATTAETVAEHLERAGLDLPIESNDKILSFIELFQGRLHDFMQSGLTRGQRYLPMIRNVFQSEGVPLSLAYVPLVESAFKSTALSRVSARGMWQFMLPTAEEHGLKQDWFIDERSDPEKATRAAAQYLKTLHRFFDGNWDLALASYNAGPGRLQRAVRQSKKNDYWAITSSTKYLPRETRDYVPMIYAAIIIANDPGLYGFDVPSATPLAYEIVEVPGALDLKIIAEWSEIEIADLQDLNPDLRRLTTPTGTHKLKVPLGTAAAVTAKLRSAEPALFRDQDFKFHSLRRGETLTTVARRYKVTLSQLRSANDLTSRSRVRVGQTLLIPQRPAPALPTASAPRTAAASARTANSPLTYRVQRGDTLHSIANRFDTTVQDLKKLNSLATDRINIGDRLTVRR
jgi:membrane-bound lytic murein transglycosylase D